MTSLRKAGVVVRTAALAVACCAALLWQQAAGAEEGDTKALLDALGKTKQSLVAGMQQASTGGAVPISAKFEMEDGKLSLSVYTAGKGVSVPAEKNVLQELSGSPEDGKWAPKTEVFADVPHVARSAEQLAIVALGKTSLIAAIGLARKNHAGTVFSVTPAIRNHQPVAVILFADKGKVTKVIQPL